MVINLSVSLVVRIDWKHVWWKLEARLHLSYFRRGLDDRFLSLSFKVLDVDLGALNVSRNLIKIPESFTDVPALLQIFNST